MEKPKETVNQYIGKSNNQKTLGLRKIKRKIIGFEIWML